MTYTSVLGLFTSKEIGKLQTLAVSTLLNPVGIAAHQKKLLGVELPTVTIQSLVDSSLNETSTQYDINPNNVYKIVSSLLSESVLHRHIEIGFTDFTVDDDGEVTLLSDDFIITGGRHRLTALLTIAELMGVLDAPEFYNQEVEVMAQTYDVRTITASNGSRKMSAPETASVTLTHSGVDVNDPLELVELFLSRKVSSAALGLAFKSLTVDTDLSPTTLSNIGKSVYNNFINSDPAKRAACRKSSELTLFVLNAAAELLPQVVDEFVSSGVTNIARDAGGVGVRLAALVADMPETKAYLRTLQPEAKPKQTQQKRVSTTRKPASTSVNLMPEQPELDNTEEVAVPSASAPEVAAVVEAPATPAKKRGRPKKVATPVEG